MASSSPAVPAVAVFSAVAMAFAAAAPAWAVEPDSSRDPVAAPGFSDVTGGPHLPGIEALDELGLFEGTLCGEERFCPQDEMPRWVMAVWFARALPGDDPVPAASSRFADVDPREWWAPHVERLAELGVTVGCKRTPLRFCPGRGVNRGQMATFLARALGLVEAPADPPEFGQQVGEGAIPHTRAPSRCRRRHRCVSTSRATAKPTISAAASERTNTEECSM